MSAPMMNERSSNTTAGFPSGRWIIVLIAFLALAGFFLLAEHRAHVLGTLPYVLILACPLLHLFMHRGHSGHGDRPGKHHIRGRG